MDHLRLGKETLTFLQSLFQNVSDAILVLNEKGTVIGVNRSFEQMTGWQESELLGSAHLCEICRGTATCEEELTCVDCFANQLKVPAFEMRVRKKDGHETAVTASSTRLQDNGLNSLVLILRDITEQQRMERERHQRQLTNHVIQAQEEERKRISRDLHDGIGQALYSIMVGLRVVNQLEIDTAVKEHLDNVQQLTARTLEEVKTMSVELRPSALDDFGLVPALRSYAKRFEQTFGLEVDLAIFGHKRRYAPTVETALYRICQEAMTNSAKYADADKIYLSFIDEENCVKLQIKDYGRGFDPKQLRIRGTGLGLYGMRERASLIGGHLIIEAAPDAGASITVTIPLDEKGGPLHVNPFADR